MSEQRFTHRRATDSIGRGTYPASKLNHAWELLRELDQSIGTEDGFPGLSTHQQSLLDETFDQLGLALKALGAPRDTPRQIDCLILGA